MDNGHAYWCSWYTSQVHRKTSHMVKLRPHLDLLVLVLFLTLDLVLYNIWSWLWSWIRSRAKAVLVLGPGPVIFLVPALVPVKIPTHSVCSTQNRTQVLLQNPNMTNMGLGTDTLDAVNKDRVLSPRWSQWYLFTYLRVPNKCVINFFGKAMSSLNTYVDIALIINSCILGNERVYRYC